MPAGCVNRVVWGVPNPLERGTKSGVVHKWLVYVNPVHGGYPMPWSTEQNQKSVWWWLRDPYCVKGHQRFWGRRKKQKWRTSGRSGYIILAVKRFIAGGAMRSGQKVGMVATASVPLGGSLTLASGRQN